MCVCVCVCVCACKFSNILRTIRSRSTMCVRVNVFLYVCLRVGVCMSYRVHASV